MLTMNTYEPKDIEQKWQKRWADSGVFQADDSSSKPKYYALIEFPYPSGEGLHVGHLRSYTAMDIVSRKRRMEGFNVLYPIGYDAFGLPAENYALKTGQHPRVTTEKNCANFERQLKAAGFSFDWSRQVNTTDPAYYTWTQWIFLQFLKHGLAYKATVPINWCPKDKIGLANEEVVNGCCERCDTPVEKRNKEQWMLKITAYAEKLLEGLDSVDYIERAKVQQENWIGKSEGAEIEFKIRNQESGIRVFTTRPDTLFGVTYVVLAPEHALVEKLKLQITNGKEVQEYIIQVKNKTDIERTATDKEKTGVELKGIVAINPVNGEEVPVWVADYVLAHYGTGAVMAVPQHDDRDRAFAEKFHLPIIDKPLVSFAEALQKSGGKKQTTYKLRDWVFSRQRYWGEPIPVIHCAKCGTVPVPEDQLPVLLPEVEKYEPTDTGESPLAAIDSWVNTKCPKCDGTAKRETDVMPNWAGSSWYFLRYIDSKNDKAFASMKKLQHWMPVDWYNGGMEHTVLHLLYSRFWNQFLCDIGLVPTSEPYKKRTSHGLIMASDGEKMSKSRGNVVNPDEIIARFGADSVRLYEMFIGPFDQPAPWSTDGLVGTYRFLEKVWKLHEKIGEHGQDSILKATQLLHKTIKKVGDDIEAMRFNTAVSAMMILVNEMSSLETVPQDLYEKLLVILSPFAPHMAEELWEMLRHKELIARASWPKYDEAMTIDNEVVIPVQVNGKLRDTITVSADASKEMIEQAARASEKVQKSIGKKEIIRVVVVPGKLCNFVVKE